MTETRVDFAVLGASPQARLIAGLLASAHGKSVLFRGESQSGYRLSRGIDLSVGLITRPETWAMLKTNLPEATRLIARVAKRSWSRLDPIFFADEAAGHSALAHVRHMAAAFGHAAERVPATQLGKGREGLVLRDAVMLHRVTLEPALDRWLEQLGVIRNDADSGFTLHADGSAETGIGEDAIAIGQTILADDGAILTHLPRTQWPDLLRRRLASTILTEPTGAIVAPVMHQLESGVTLTQPSERGIVAFGPGNIDQFAEALRVLLGRDRAFRQAGQSNYEQIVTGDGAPAVGRAGGVGPDILTGFGTAGAFLAPAIARWLCGAASETENAWLSARLVTRRAGDASVADVGTQP